VSVLRESVLVIPAEGWLRIRRGGTSPPPKEPEMTRRIRLLTVGLLAAATTAAAFATPAIYAGITLNALD
jgi:hypothetical protein